MTTTVTPAADKLANLAACRKVAPWQADEETLVCTNDWLELEFVRGHWEHSHAEIKALRAAAEVGWPPHG